MQTDDNPEVISKTTFEACISQPTNIDLSVNHYVTLINQLKSEISHLRKDCLNKNYIIEQLIASQSQPKNIVNEDRNILTRISEKSVSIDKNANEKNVAMNRDLINVKTFNSFKSLNQVDDTERDVNTM